MHALRATWGEEGWGSGFDGAVSLFCDYDFGGSFDGVGFFLIRYFVAVDEGNDGGVSLEGAGFSEVSEFGTFVGSFFELSVELGEGDKGEVEFFGSALRSWRSRRSRGCGDPGRCGFS